jgi:amino acid transporter
MIERPAFVPGRRGTAPGSIFHRRLALLPLVMVLFVTVSGGAFGLEPAVGESGAGMALLLPLLVPLLRSVPAAMMVAELSSAMPVEGGYYAWVKRALGSFWGFQEGWWSWVNCLVDMAIYPMLFTTYLSQLVKRHVDTRELEENDALSWLLRLALIWGCTVLNLRGVRAVGRAAMLFAVLVMAPFLVMSAIGLQNLVADRPPI